MFRTYYFSEMPYPYTPTLEFAEVARTTMPTRWFDPDAAHDVYHKYFDLVLAADDIGLDVMFNEHHETMSNMDAAMPLSMAIAARETKNARILALGNPVANRPDPVRVATEMAMIDVVSEGSPRLRVCAGRLLRDVGDERPADRHEAAPVRSDRPHRQGMDLA